MPYIKMLFLLMFFAVGTSLRSQTTPSAAIPGTSGAGVVVDAVRVDEIITIDGRLTEGVWQAGPPVTTFYQREPVEGAQPSERTSVRVAYDDGALYIGARMFDRSPDSIIARLGRRDNYSNSDRFVLFLDPYHDHRTGNFFGINAAGTLFDGTLYNDDWDDDSWDGVWEGKVTIDAEGWVAEMRIPFSQLRFHNAGVQTWGINFRRDIQRRNEYIFLSFTPRNGSGFASRFADLQGIEQITASSKVEVLPYLTTRAEYLQHASNDPFNTGSKYIPRMGADIKTGIGSNLTLNVTINPDFGQVEVDPAVVNLSDAETIYQEKRPFFIEGSSIFSFGSGGANNNWSFNWAGLDFLHSRRIGRTPQGSLPEADFAEVPVATNILGAAKLSGKLGGSWSIGTIQAVTRREFAEIDSAGIRSDIEVEPLSYYGVARAQKEFSEGRQALGFMTTYTRRMFRDDRLRGQINSNGLVFGTDGWTFLDREKVWVLTFWGAVSRVAGSRAQITSLQQSSRHYYQRPDIEYVAVDTNATSLEGYAARFRLNKQKGNFYVNSSFGFVNPGFDPNDAGLLTRTDIVNMHLVSSYRWSEPTSFYRFLELGGATFRNYDFGGNRTWEGYMHFGSIRFPNYYSIRWSAVYNPETVNPRRTRGGPLTVTPHGYETNVNIQSDTRNAWSFYTGEYTYDGPHVHTFNAWAGVQWQPSSNVSIDFGPSYYRDRSTSAWVGVFTDPLATATFGKRYVFGELDRTELSADLRLNWTLTPQLSLQMYVQPFFSSGEYTNFKELARPRSYDFTVYGENGTTFDGATHKADPDGSGPANELELGNPDFNFKSIRGNAVLRWEYLPGSTLYFVWTQSRSDIEGIGDFRFNRSVRRLLDATPDNIFMVKATYWWNL